ncbi:MAG: hypothetical protein M0Q38_00020 [Bacteroidales bacterium]|jgi:hypothetical protein|nr:hypothetical protein [Bacteroidales bacterium]
MKKFTKTAMNQLHRSVQCFITVMVISLSGFSQNVAINTTLNPANPSAGLDIDFATKGLLISRVALSGTSSFAPLIGHIAGMMVYNTATAGDVKPGLYYNDGYKWIAFVPPDGNTTGDMQYWNGTAWVTLPAGQTGQMLQLTSAGIPAWSNGGLPTLTTVSVTLITSTTASSGGSITSDGGSAITARGVCWSATAGPTIANSKTTDGSGVGNFSSNLTGLATATTYYVRAYATNTNGTAYGNEVSFITP